MDSVKGAKFLWTAAKQTMCRKKHLMKTKVVAQMELKLKWHQNEIIVQLDVAQAGQFDHQQSRCQKDRK